MKAQTIADAIGRFLRLFGVGVPEQDREFVAAKTRGKFGCAAMLLHHAGEALQRQGARQVAEAIVDGFQVVQVEEQKRERLAGAARATTLLLQALHEFAIVGQAGWPSCAAR